MRHWKTAAAIVLLSILVYVFVGCGGKSKTTIDQTVGPQTYTASFGNIKVTLQLPAKPDAITKALDKFEQAWQASINEPINYIIGSFKVQNGSKKRIDSEQQITFTLVLTDGSDTPSTLGSDFVHPPPPDESDPNFTKQDANLNRELRKREIIDPGSTTIAYTITLIP